jgi:hypothetical protein
MRHQRHWPDACLGRPGVIGGGQLIEDGGCLRPERSGRAERRTSLRGRSFAMLTAKPGLVACGSAKQVREPDHPLREFQRL